MKCQRCEAVVTADTNVTFNDGTKVRVLCRSCAGDLLTDAYAGRGRIPGREPRTQRPEGLPKIEEDRTPRVFVTSTGMRVESALTDDEAATIVEAKHDANDFELSMAKAHRDGRLSEKQRAWLHFIAVKEQEQAGVATRRTSSVWDEEPHVGDEDEYPHWSDAPSFRGEPLWASLAQKDVPAKYGLGAQVRAQTSRHRVREVAPGDLPKPCRVDGSPGPRCGAAVFLGGVHVHGNDPHHAPAGGCV